MPIQDMKPVPVAAGPLGPGDDDARSPAVAVAEAAASAALGPGDDDPRSPAKGVAGIAASAAGPGDSIGDEPDPDLVMLAPAPAGPGGTDSGPRHVAVVRRRPPTLAAPIHVTPPAPVAQTSTTTHAPALPPDDEDKD